MSGPVKIERVSGRAVVVRGNDIDTDQIIPARYLRSIRFDGLEEHVFRDLRYGPDGEVLKHSFNDSVYDGASILVVNRNFGCGSSREHAPQALKRWGIRAIVGESFAEIFFGNCTALGIPAVCLAEAEVLQLMSAVEIAPDIQVSVDVGSLEVSWPSGRAAGSMPAAAGAALANGSWDALGTLLSAEPEIRATAARIPYVSGF